MDFLELAKQRYTTKKYDPSKKLSEAKIRELKEILHLSPSSINSQPWKFTFVSDESVKGNLADVSMFNAGKVNGASHLVVFSALDSVDAFFEQLKTYASDANRERYLQYTKSMPEDEIRPWMQRQVYISLGYFLSACAAAGVDATPMEGIDCAKYDEILNLEGYKTLFAVAIGYRAEDDVNQPSITPKSRIPLEQVIRSV